MHSIRRHRSDDVGWQSLPLFRDPEIITVKREIPPVPKRQSTRTRELWTFRRERRRMTENQKLLCREFFTWGFLPGGPLFLSFLHSKEMATKKHISPFSSLFCLSLILSLFETVGFGGAPPSRESFPDSGSHSIPHGIKNFPETHTTGSSLIRNLTVLACSFEAITK